MDKRIHSIDLLRGIVMILMTLGHTRGFFLGKISYEDYTIHTAIIFITRILSNLCAPTFFFLAGISIYLIAFKQQNKVKTSQFLIKRGLWLILLEFSIMTFFWRTHFNVIQLQVLWIYGISFLIMAALIYLPPWFHIFIAISIISLHNLWGDGINGDTSEFVTLLLTFIHKPGIIYVTDNFELDVLYNVVPWTGIMILGFGMARIYNSTHIKRRIVFYTSGLLAVVLFLLLRRWGVYGDPSKFNVVESSPIENLITFFNLTKYPASLQFILLYLGITLIILAWTDNISARRFPEVQLLGKVALFFYIIHIPLIRAAAKAYSLLFSNKPGIMLLLFIWIVFIFLLYVLCKRYYLFKRKNIKIFPLLKYL